MAALLWRALPDEVLVAIARLLLGFEVLRLSHVERHLLRVLSRAELFASRLSHVRYQRGSTDARGSDLELIHSSTDSKRQYALESSLRFRGQPTDLGAKRLPQSYAPVFWSTEMLFGLYEQEEADSSLSFTMDAWFSLLPRELDVRQGGVLLGLQNEKCKGEGSQEPTFHCQILHVDAERNLYCSVTSEKPRVSVELESKRWYHVALVFEQRSQKVYLDGELVDSQYDQEQQLESFPYYYAQIGTGFVNDDFYNGWNTFHGVVDDLRIWHEAMSLDQVAELSRGGAAVLRRPIFSLKRDVPAWLAHGVEKVRCSRPLERWCQIVATCKRTEDIDLEAWV
ncbi:hypothetical protein P3T76_011414 [Phytophthora citrophthora]|uniref:LamG-like jellyroll fold domain-containing protein n=1 Tax=Phytophthora citrophthora TaxID=4793 RepID=A0AAD9G979_9STRA|nr:hypothetical protein P3T76_011414 [Phytophthora citrophthora]